MKYFVISSRISLTVFIWWLVVAAPARGDFIITAGSTTITPANNGIGTVNFYITSNNPLGDQLGIFQIQLLASQFSGPGPANLFFPQNQPTVFDQNGTQLGQPYPYVFYGNSAAQDFGFSFWPITPSNPFTTTTPNDTIVGGDFNDSAQGYTTIMPGTTYLLASVEVDPPYPTDVFSIQLVPFPSVPGTGGTYFNDSNGNPISYTSTPALVYIQGPTLTPVPPSVLLAAIGGLGGLLFSWRRRRQARTRASQVVGSQRMRKN